jgi:ATP-dependent helicase HrpB
MSATLDNERLRQALPDAPVISSEGRAFPVERRYQPLPPISVLTKRSPLPPQSCCVRSGLLLFLPGVGKSSACRSSFLPA